MSRSDVDAELDVPTVTPEDERLIELLDGGEARWAVRQYRRMRGLE